MSSLRAASILCLTLACSPPDSDVNIDADGVATRILSAAESRHTVESEPVWSAGSEQDPLLYVTGARWLSDGRVVVGSAGTDAVRYYDRAGGFVTSVGGEGQGPGEFGIIRSIHRLDRDSIAVWDPTQRRITVLTPEASVARIEPVNRSYELTLGDQIYTATVYEIRFSTAGFRVVEPSVGGARLMALPNGIHRDTLPQFIYQRGDTIPVPLGPLAGPERIAYEQVTSTRPFGHRLFVAVGSDVIYVGSGKPATVDVYDPSGLLIERLSFPLSVVNVTASAFEEFIRRQAERFEAPVRPIIEGVLRSVPPPETLPAYSALLVDHEQRLWVKVYALSETISQEWLVYEPESKDVIRVVIPFAGALLDASAADVLMMVTDSMDIERVERHRIANR